MDSMLSLVYRTLFFLLHYLYNIIFSIRRVSMYLLSKLHHDKPIQYEENYLKQRVHQLNKIPTHIVFILGSEKPSYVDLARLIIWCIASGITVISLYDYQGFLKKTERDLQNAVIDKRKEYGDKIVWNKSYLNGIHTNGHHHRNGHIISRSSKYQVNIVSFVDGQQSVVNAAKQLAETTSPNTDLNIELLDKYIQNKFKFPAEPDLGIIFGSIYCTYGFLPWFIRTTEFLKQTTHHHIPVESFYQMLAKYAKCEQRYGK